MRALFALAAALMVLANPFSGAKAAPQMLGVIASYGAVPLNCAGEVCRAELSSFCLQEHRPVPPAGTNYSAVSGDGATLVVTTVDGNTRRFDASEYLRFASARNYTAVTARIPVRELAALGAGSAAIEIGEGVALVPDPVAGDQEPQTEADVALAIRARRSAGAAIVDRKDGATAARALGRIVNALSPDAHGSVTPREALWRDSMGQLEGDPDAAGLERAAQLYKSCQARARRDSDAGLRWCLQLRHDALILELNGTYWESLRTGS